MAGAPFDLGILINNHLTFSIPWAGRLCPATEVSTTPNFAPLLSMGGNSPGLPRPNPP
jgi:hypothetical protein